MVLQLVVFLSLGKDGEWQRVRPGHLGVPKWKYVLAGRVGGGGGGGGVFVRQCLGAQG